MLRPGRLRRPLAAGTAGCVARATSTWKNTALLDPPTTQRRRARSRRVSRWYGQYRQPVAAARRPARGRTAVEVAPARPASAARQRQSRRPSVETTVYGWRMAAVLVDEPRRRGRPARARCVSSVADRRCADRRVQVAVRRTAHSVGGCRRAAARDTNELEARRAERVLAVDEQQAIRRSSVRAARMPCAPSPGVCLAPRALVGDAPDAPASAGRRPSAASSAQLHVGAVLAATWAAAADASVRCRSSSLDARRSARARLTWLPLFFFGLIVYPALADARSSCRA